MQTYFIQLVSSSEVILVDDCIYHDQSIINGRMKSQYTCVKMATILDGKLYVKTFSMLSVDCSNGHVCLS